MSNAHLLFSQFFYPFAKKINTNMDSELTLCKETKKNNQLYNN